MEKGDSTLNIRQQSQSQTNLNEFSKSPSPSMASSLKLPLIIVGSTLVLTLVLGLSLGLTQKGKSKKPTKLNIAKEVDYGAWNESYKKASQFISKLNSTERVNLLFGTENMIMETLLFEDWMLQYKCVGQIDPFNNTNVNFKGMCLQDGPAGVRFANGTGISWHASINNAMTFDKKLMYDVGYAQGQENKEKGINVALAPCANMMRNPKGGRVWEAYGDDPYYVGVCAAEPLKVFKMLELLLV